MTIHVHGQHLQLVIVGAAYVVPVLGIQCLIRDSLLLDPHGIYIADIELVVLDPQLVVHVVVGPTRRIKKSAAQQHAVAVYLVSGEVDPHLQAPASGQLETLFDRQFEVVVGRADQLESTVVVRVQRTHRIVVGIVGFAVVVRVLKVRPGAASLLLQVGQPVTIV